MAEIKINNVSYSWGMLELISEELKGSLSADPGILAGVTGVKWNIEQKVETNYGLGAEPRGRGFGNKTYAASITMDYATAVELRKKCGGNLMNLGQFDLRVSFANINDVVDIETEVVVLQGCFFHQDGMEVKQDDTNIEMEYDLNPYRILFDSDGGTPE